MERNGNMSEQELDGFMGGREMLTFSYNTLLTQ